MPVTEIKLRQMAAFQRQLDKKRRATIQARTVEAWVEVRRLVVEFQEIDPALERVVLFGSLARGLPAVEDFDIDLAVVCSPEKYLNLVAAALNSQFRVDLVDFLLTDERIRTSVEREGLVLFEMYKEDT
jgi:predicted nucleotidyltransferase